MADVVEQRSIDPHLNSEAEQGDSDQSQAHSSPSQRPLLGLLLVILVATAIAIWVNNALAG